MVSLCPLCSLWLLIHIKAEVRVMPTASASVTEEFLTDDVGFEEISMLPIDHPGAHDPEYRARRNFIARLAKQYREDPEHVIPDVDYTPQETDIWRHVYDQLEETHRRRASSLYLESKRKLGISRDQIPQLRGLDARLKETSNFHIAPIEGLVEARAFLSWLGKRTRSEEYTSE